MVIMMKVRRMLKNSPMSMFESAKTLQITSMVSRIAPQWKARGKDLRNAWVAAVFFSAQT